MQEVNWQVLDRDKIVDLIVWNNSTVPMPPEYTRRLRGRLKAMDAVTLWDHVMDKYGGVLYTPEDDRSKYHDPRIEHWRPVVRKKTIIMHDVKVPMKRNEIWELETELAGKEYTESVCSCKEGVIVITYDAKKTERYARKYHPSVHMEIMEIDAKHNK